jgi:hypothetical protein
MSVIEFLAEGNRNGKRNYTENLVLQPSAWHRSCIPPDERLGGDHWDLTDAPQDSRPFSRFPQHDRTYLPLGARLPPCLGHPIGLHEFPKLGSQSPHKGIFLGCPLLEQVKREQSVGNTEDHQQQNGNQEPGVILIYINELFFIPVPTSGLSAATKKKKFQSWSGM